LPAIWRRSKKLVALAWMAIRYWSSVGMGSGRPVSRTSWGLWIDGLRGVWVISRAWGAIRALKGDRKEAGLYLNIFFDLNASHC
jgi:hypothetical protein